MDSDLVTQVQTLDREAFVTGCPFPLLMAVNEPGPAVDDDPFPESITTTLSGKHEEPPAMQAASHPVLYAVRKVHSVIPHGIVLGRAPTSDVLIRDLQVSKSHALFQEIDGAWQISDIGSRNGTHVNNQRLEPRGAAAALSFGDIVNFGFRTFYFLDSGSVWDRLRR